MLWVDHKSYFGPDRRRARGMRLRERRRYDYAGRPPSLSAALRQLRMHVLDARGAAGVGAFADRVNAVAVLAEISGEAEASMMLSRLAIGVGRNREADVRPALYNALDRVQGAMHEHH